jgi:hypothetical protein
MAVQSCSTTRGSLAGVATALETGGTGLWAKRAPAATGAESVAYRAVWDEIAESENLRSPQRRSGFAPAGAHAASEHGSAAQTMLRFAARVLRDLAKRLQRGQSRSERQ